MKKLSKIYTFILILMLGFSAPLFASSILQPLTDSTNSGIINTKMVASDRLSGSNVDATVINGVAVFSGQVKSKAQLDELIRIAHSVSGIKGVNVSQITIK